MVLLPGWRTTSVVGAKSSVLQTVPTVICPSDTAFLRNRSSILYPVRWGRIRHLWNACTTVQYHLFADDMQCYNSRPSSDSPGMASWVPTSAIGVQPSDNSWMPVRRNYFGSVPRVNSVNWRQNVIKPSSTDRELGVLFDAELSMRQHVSRTDVLLPPASSALSPSSTRS